MVFPGAEKLPSKTEWPDQAAGPTRRKRGQGNMVFPGAEKLPSKTEWPA